MIKEKRGINPKAFKEVREIIKYFPKNDYRKIPESFISFLEDNMDENYDYKVSHVDDFHNQEMLEETKIILAIIYKDYIATEKEKNYIIDKERRELLEKEKSAREKYNPDMLFKKEEGKVEVEKTIEEGIDKEEIEKEEKYNKIIEKKESIFDKIKKWFKNFFKK